MPSPQGSLPEPADRYRRYLLAAGTRDYVDPEACLPEVPGELAKVVELFTSLGFKEQLADLRLNPTTEELRGGVNRWLWEEGRTNEDVAVIYYTGHGTTDADHHYLCTASTVDQQYAGTALETDFLIRVLSNAVKVRRVLIVLDTCDSGRGALDVSEVAGRMAAFQRQQAPDEGVWVIAASRPKEAAFQVAFVNALGEAIEWLSGVTGRVQEYLSLESLVDRVNKLLERGGYAQRAAYKPARLGMGLPPILRNPRYDPLAEPGRDLESAAATPLRRADVDAHWDPRARGVDVQAQRGLYFSGRHAALRTLVGWITDPRDDRAPRVVTGAPGSGKSAVLARLVMLADRGRRRVPLEGVPHDTVPPVGSVHAAVLARRKTVEDVLEELGAALGVSAESGAELAAALASREAPVVVVVDALDEARQPDLVARQVLEPLAGAGVRLLVGARRPLLRRLPFAFQTVDLDAGDYYRRDDLRDYVIAVLLAESDPGSPTSYRGEPEAAREVATAVADRAEHSFLIARVVARALTRARRRLAGQELAAASRNWSSLGAVFEEDLSRYEGDRDLVRDLLTPLAWAEGEGLPWENLWAPLAGVLAGDLAYSDDDVRWLLENAGAYVVEAMDQGRAVFRLYHQEFADYLRRGRDPRDANATMTRALLDRVPTDTAGRRGWFAAHLYLRTHLATHAAHGGLIDDLLVDAGFLLAADPIHLTRNVFAAQTAAAQAAVSVYLRFAEHLRGSAAADPAPYLGLLARQEGQPALADAADRLSLAGGWRARWVRWRTTSPHLVLDRLDARVSALECFARDGRSFLAMADLDGHIRVMDLETGDSVFVEKLPSAVWSLTVFDVDGVDLLVAGDQHGEVHIWSLLEGRLVTHFRAHHARAEALFGGSLEGRPVLVTSGREPSAEENASRWSFGPGVFRVWDARTWSPLSSECRAFGASVDSLHLMEIAGRTTLVCAGDAVGEEAETAGLVRGFDPLTGAQRFQLPTGPYGLATALPTRRGDGEWRLLVRLTSGNSIARWDLVEQRVVQEASCPGTMALAVTEVVVAGRHVVCVDQFEGLQLLDAESLEPVGSPLIGHMQTIREICAGVVNGRPVVISADDSGAIRSWDLSTLTTSGPTQPEVGGSIRALALDPTGDALLCAPDNGLLERRSRATGALLHTAKELPRVNALATSAAGDGVVAVAADKEVLSLAPGDLSPLMVLRGHEGTVRALAVTRWRDRDIVATAGHDGTVRLWDPRTGDPLAEPLLEPGYEDKAFYAVAFASGGGRHMVLAGGSNRHVIAWDLERVLDLDAGPHVRSLSLTRTEVAVASPHTDYVRALAVSSLPHGDLVFSVGDDRRLVLFDAAQPREARSLDRVHGDWIKCACVGGPGARILLTGGDDGVLRTWRVGDDGVDPGASIMLDAPIRAITLDERGTAFVGTAAGLAAIDLTDDLTRPADGKFRG